jgi:hypothetical protein
MEAKPIQTRRKFLKVAAIDSGTGRTFDVLVSYDRLHWVKNRGLGAIKEAGFNVPFVLQHPKGVFEGLCREQDEDRPGYGWWCYCAVPPHDYAENGDEKLPRPNRIFLVFVNTDHIAYNWRWEKVDPDDDRFPIGFQTRFRRQVI